MNQSSRRIRSEEGATEAMDRSRKAKTLEKQVEQEMSKREKELEG